MPDDFGVWVYAVAGTLAPQWFSQLGGVAGGPIRVLGAGELSAAVTTVSLTEFGEQALRRHLENLDWLEPVARAHHSVVEVAASHGPVLPMRLATVCLSDTAVAAMLMQRQRAFTAALSRITGRVEWGVKLSAVQARATESTADGDSALAGDGPGAAFLRRRRFQLTASENAKRAAMTSAQEIDQALGALAIASYARPPQHSELTSNPERMIFNGAYLVEEATSADFAAAVKSMKGQYPDLLIDLTGPWPPYSFASVEDDDVTMDHS